MVEPKKNEISPFATSGWCYAKWNKKDKYHMISVVCGIYKKKNRKGKEEKEKKNEAKMEEEEMEEEE